MNKILLWALLPALLFVGCKRRSAPTAEEAINREMGTLVITAFQYDFLQSRARLSFQGPDDRFSATATIRMQEDSVLWMSVSPGLGIEVMRCLATSDSVRVIDRLNKKNYLFDYPALSRKLGFVLTFDLLQAIVVGNLPFPDLARRKIRRDDPFFVIEQAADSILLFNYVNSQSAKLERVQATETNSKSQLVLEYKAFEALDGKLFPHETDVRLAPAARAQGTTTLNIRHTKVEALTSSPGFPFDMPGNFERITQ